MKTHQNSNGKSVTGSENNSLESPRSTPDSTSETGKGTTRDRPQSLDDDEDGSDGQTADNEEEEEDLDEDDDEEEDELDDEEDLDDSMMAEDLSTRGPNSSTPVPRGSPNSDQTKAPKATPEDVAANNDNNSSNTISISNGENGNNNEEKESPKPETRHSLLGEVMDKIGLSNIQQYNEAYKKALEESSLKNSSKPETETPNRDRSLVTENGPERPNNRDDNSNISNISKHGNSNSKSLALHQHSLEFGHGFFGAFDYNHHHHHNAFEASKRLKLDIADHLRNSNDRDSFVCWTLAALCPRNHSQGRLRHDRSPSPQQIFLF
ncbi:hypothetical protein CEXT_261201 [Caerostris extrusa]|uniref:Uncharacterized protein n=1 Tax=Caerostris extrusa TaxID=172846 RepID=A0AAV4U0E4_CAEEX|nr:hypothetical protein CEXT_261201 [Caerostris extrusa]